MTLKIDLQGKRAFIAGIADDQGFGWAIAKSLAEAGASISIGVWPPVLGIFQKLWQQGKFDESRRLSDGSLLSFDHVLPLDASFDHPDDVPEDIKNNKRYKQVSNYTISELANYFHTENISFDLLVHSLANGPEVKKDLLETSRKGYLTAVSVSTYSFISLLQHLGPHMNKGSAALTLSYIAAERSIPGYGGGMSSAKAALESDVRTLAWEAGRKWGLRINAISAGPLASRAAKAIGFIERMIRYAEKNAPLAETLKASEVGASAAFLLSPLASGITGTLLHVDKGNHVMGVAVDSLSLNSD